MYRVSGESYRPQEVVVKRQITSSEARFASMTRMDEREPRNGPPAGPAPLRADDPRLYVPPTTGQLQASERSWFVRPPWGWRHPVAGRHGWLPDPSLLAFGQYLKRSRYLAAKTQTQLEAESGVDQGMISRLERALAPYARIDRLVRLSDALGRALPFGYCPHEHFCPWQPVPPPPADPPIDRLSPELRRMFNRVGSDNANDAGDG